MSSITFRAIDKTMQKTFQDMMKRASKVEGFLQKVVYKTYQKRQKARWMSENESEGTKWQPLKPKYQSYKLKKFASYDGGGRKMMIATGRLKDAVIGDNGSSEHRKIIQGKTLKVQWVTPYAVYTEKVRSVNVWNDKQDDEIRQKAFDYLIKGELL